jgi:hypothetical protein
MCMICQELNKGFMKPKEIARALFELNPPKEHVNEILAQLFDELRLDDALELVFTYDELMESKDK